MNVFIPHQKDDNIYLDEIIAFSKCNFIFGHHKEYKDSYEIVNIHFPEAIFDWKMPTEEQLADLESNIHLWKQKSKIVFTMNDLKAHYNDDAEFIELFRLIHKYADGVIHLGNFSLTKYKGLFSCNCQHTVIYHPLYLSLLDNFDTKDVGNLIPVDFEKKYVVSVIGKIRSKEEIDLIMKVFRKIPKRNKVLIIPRMYNLIEIPTWIPWRFRKAYKGVVYKFFFNFRGIYFLYSFLEYPYLVDLVKRSSMMIIPRIRNLNSGNFYLGLTFDIPMVIPAVGNLTEAARFLGLPILDLEKRNFDEILKTILEQGEWVNKDDYLVKKSQFNPDVVANQYDTFFNQLILN